MHSLKFKLAFLIISYLKLFFFSSTILAQQPQPHYTWCSNTTSFASNSGFGTNLKTLLSSLSSNAAVNDGFFNDTIGDDPDQVYALAQCRGDVGRDDCRSCLDEASLKIIQGCNKTSASIWYDYCMLKYSNQRFFGEIASFRVFWNAENATQPDEPNISARLLMYPLIRSAVSQPSMFAAAQGESVSGFTRVYGFVQCRRDLSRNKCRECLGQMMVAIERCCEGKRGWRIIGSSCMIRYEMYKFFNSSTFSPEKDRRLSIKVVIILTVGSFLFMAIVVSFVYYFLWRRKKYRQEKKEFSQEILLHDLGPSNNNTLFLYDNKEETDKARSQELPFIDLASIVAATNNFSSENKLGEGGFGPVYKGILPNKKEIAVKRLSRSSGQGLEEFKNEVTLIAKLQHKNLVRLLYCCIEKNEKLLIYEYMPNTSLDIFLIDPNKHIQLDWRRRYNIIVGIVRGLLYLHEDSRLKIIHRDLKPSNVLLDHDMNPKISDFGMARIFEGNQCEANTNRVVGTYGYMAPEYAMDGLFSVKSDVFSFGVLLLEIVTGKKNGRFMIGEQAQSLLTYAWQVWRCGQGLELIDLQIVETCPVDKVLKCIHIGLLCVQEDAAKRPTMSRVGLMLASEYVTLPSPTKPAFYTGNIVPISDGPSNSAKICSVNEITISDIQAR